jgi:hypothetical protein
MWWLWSWLIPQFPQFVVSNEFGGVYSWLIFPWVMGWGIAFPSDKVLLLFLVNPISEDHFNFPFWFAFYKVRWRFQEVRAVCIRFVIGGEEWCVEYVMNFPCGG